MSLFGGRNGHNRLTMYNKVVYLKRQSGQNSVKRYLNNRRPRRWNKAAEFTDYIVTLKTNLN